MEPPFPHRTQESRCVWGGGRGASLSFSEPASKPCWDLHALLQRALRSIADVFLLKLELIHEVINGRIIPRLSSKITSAISSSKQAFTTGDKLL